MTRAQLRVYNRLTKKQANRHNDVIVVEESISSVTFYVLFPGLYVTYDDAGRPLETHTDAERRKSGKTLAKPGMRTLVLTGELGSSSYQPPGIDDDGVPF
jgi:hypothetical protein